MKRTFLVTLFSIMILVGLVPYVPKVKATLSSGILADAMGTIINAHSWQPTDGDSQVPHYATVFSVGSSSYYQTAAQLASSYVFPCEVLATKRLAELDGVPSAVSDATLQAYLSGATMLGYVPVTWNGYFLIYDRFEAHAYDWAVSLGLGSKWNKQAALQQIDTIVRSANPGQVGSLGTYIGYNQNGGWVTYYRYYDDTAETLEWFLEVGGNSYLSTCDLIWNFQNNGFASPGYNPTPGGPYGYFWNGQYYDYDNTNLMETCVGYFALISGRYLVTKGILGTYGSRIVSDLNQKLLINGYGSPLWDGYTLDHVPGRGEHRLPETVPAWAAMQAYYPIMTSAMQGTLRGMCSVGWKGLLSDPDFDPATNMFRPSAVGTFTMGATGQGLMIMFLNGIVPEGGSLAVPLNDESYGDRGFEFPASMFNFNYASHSIRIPVNAGKLNFIFGSGTASYTFPSTGVYQVQFSSDWNTVQSANMIAGLNSNFKYIPSGSVPPPTTGTLKVTATYNGAPVAVQIQISGPTSTTVTTTTDPNNPAQATVNLGIYTLSGTYSGQTLSESAQVSTAGQTVSVAFPFTSAPPTTGTLKVFAKYADGYVAVQVSIVGPGYSHTGTTTTDPQNPLSYTVNPGTYQVSGTYQSTPINKSFTVQAGNSIDAILDFGGGNWMLQWLSQNAIPIVGVASASIISGGIVIGWKRGGFKAQPKRKRRRKS